MSYSMIFQCLTAHDLSSFCFFTLYLGTNFLGLLSPTFLSKRSVIKIMVLYINEYILIVHLSNSSYLYPVPLPLLHDNIAHRHPPLDYFLQPILLQLAVTIFHFPSSCAFPSMIFLSVPVSEILSFFCSPLVFSSFSPLISFSLLASFLSVIFLPPIYERIHGKVLRHPKGHLQLLLTKNILKKNIRY